MHAQFLLLSIGVMLMGIAILVFTITRLVGLLRTSIVARLPALPEQLVSFEQPGTYILHLEHPRFATALRRARYSLRDPASAQEVQSRPILFRTTSSGFAIVRYSVRRYTVQRPGRYALSITGIAPGSDAPKDALVFTRPYAATMVLLILGTVLGGFCLIGGLVFTALQLAGAA